MVRSMTGYGRATGEAEGETVSIELTAVNHRFLDCSFRMPHVWAALEPALRDVLKKRLSRGKVNVSVRRERGPAGAPKIAFDPDVVEQYLAACREIGSLMHTTEVVSLDTIATLDGVFYPLDESTDLDALKASLTAVLGEAVDQLEAARTNEGTVLARDTAERVAAMGEALAAVEVQLPGLADAYEERLRTRIAELNAEPGLKEERMAIEVALMADKADVNEEVVRLRAHLDRVLELLDNADPIGRELNFVAQEIQRETNTLGAKLRDIGVTREILRIKTELEKLREQAQNIE